MSHLRRRLGPATRRSRTAWRRRGRGPVTPAGVSREQGAATLMGVGGGAPVGLGGDGRAEELRNVEKKLARGWVEGEEERSGLRVEVARRRATVGGGVAERREEGELSSEVRGWRGENEIGLDGWLKRW